VRAEVGIMMIRRLGGINPALSEIGRAE